MYLVLVGSVCPRLAFQVMVNEEEKETQRDWASSYKKYGLFVELDGCTERTSYQGPVGIVWIWFKEVNYIMHILHWRMTTWACRWDRQVSHHCHALQPTPVWKKNGHTSTKGTTDWSFSTATRQERTDPQHQFWDTETWHILGSLLSLSRSVRKIALEHWQHTVTVLLPATTVIKILSDQQVTDLKNWTPIPFLQYTPKPTHCMYGLATYPSIHMSTCPIPESQSSQPPKQCTHPSSAHQYILVLAPRATIVITGCKALLGLDSGITSKCKLRAVSRSDNHSKCGGAWYPSDEWLTFRSSSVSERE